MLSFFPSPSNPVEHSGITPRRGHKLDVAALETYVAFFCMWLWWNTRHRSKVIIMITSLTIRNLEERDSDYPSFTEDEIDMGRVKWPPNKTTTWWKSLESRPPDSSSCVLGHSARWALPSRTIFILFFYASHVSLFFCWIDKYISDTRSNCFSFFC